MNIAELFVNLGIKGAEKTVGALGNVRKGLGEVSSMSLEAKAGILAVMYGLERMTAKSAEAGTGLVNFNALTGISAKTLQQWQFAARQAGVSGEELAGSMKAVQNSMTNMLLGKGAPEGMQVISKAVGGLDVNRVRDTAYMMGKLQEAAQKLPKDVGNNMLKSFGLSEGTIAAMRRNAFTPDVFSKAPTYSDQEINKLEKVDVAWSNLSNKIQMAFGHLTAKHGFTLVSDIAKLADQLVKLADTLLIIAERMKVFKLMENVFKGLGMLADDANTSLGNVQREGFTSRAKAVFNEYKTMGKYLLESTAPNENVDPNYITPTIKPAAPQGSNQNTTINQSIVHHGNAKDTQGVKDLHKTAINQAYRQRSAQGRGS